MSQDLTPHINELNHVLLTMGKGFGLPSRAGMIFIFFSASVSTLALPAAFFAALDHGANGTIGGNSTLFTDEMRGHFLTFSRGIAIILLIAYICSRVYIHDPPVFILIAWWTNKPFSLLFDLFQIAVLLGSIFLVN